MKVKVMKRECERHTEKERKKKERKRERERESLKKMIGVTLRDKSQNQHQQKIMKKLWETCQTNLTSKKFLLTY